MFQHYRLLVPFLLAGLLVFNLILAIMDQTQGTWLSVGVVALLLAFTLWRDANTPCAADPPRTGSGPDPPESLAPRPGNAG